MDTFFIDPPCSHGDIRLVGGATDNEGRVQVCVNKQWGMVCNNRWSVEDAQVVCRQLGYSPHCKCWASS